MKKLVIYKNNHTAEDLLWVILDITAIILAVNTQQYVIFIPIIVIFTLPIIKSAILWMKWFNSFAVKVENSVLILNHSLFYKKQAISLDNIQEVNIDHQYLLLKEPVRISLFNYSVKKVTFTNLSDNERKEILLFLDSLS
ncbi:MAG: hypothetical protein MJZ39_00245 [Bacteroidales bacterium]|nr:hypothetical protein [Bacteroidales bacterium]